MKQLSRNLIVALFSFVIISSSYAEEKERILV